MNKKLKWSLVIVTGVLMGVSIAGYQFYQAQHPVYATYSTNQKIRLFVIDGELTGRKNIAVENIIKISDKDHANVISKYLLDDLPNDVQVTNYAVFNQNHQFKVTDLTTALEAILHDVKSNRDFSVINLSGGLNKKDEQLNNVISKLIQTKRVLFVAAAGNTYQGNSQYPARLDTVVSVGAGQNSNLRQVASARENVNVFADVETDAGTSGAAAKVSKAVIRHLNDHNKTEKITANKIIEWLREN